MKLGGLTVGVAIDAHPSSLVKPRVRPTTPAPKLDHPLGFTFILPLPGVKVMPVPVSPGAGVPSYVTDADVFWDIRTDRYVRRSRVYRDAKVDR